MKRAKALEVIGAAKRALTDAENALEQSPDTADVDGIIGGAIDSVVKALSEASKIEPEVAA